MADAAAARREARRRRILENSHNRLQLISGKCGDDGPRESPVRHIIPDSIPEISLSSDSSKTSLNNGVIVPEPDSFELLSSLNHDIASGDGEESIESAPFVTPAAEPAPTSTTWQKLTNNRYDVVLLSLLFQLLHSLSLMTFDGTYLFLPVIIYAITKLIWFPSQNSSSKLANALQLLHIMSSHRVQKIIFLTQCTGVISCDICIFLFTTICIQSLLITLRDGLIT